MAEVELRHVSKVFAGGSVAVDDISLTALKAHFFDPDSQLAIRQMSTEATSVLSSTP